MLLTRDVLSDRMAWFSSAARHRWLAKDGVQKDGVYGEGGT